VRSPGAEVPAASGVDAGVVAYSSPWPISPASSRIWWPPCITMLRADFGFLLEQARAKPQSTFDFTRALEAAVMVV
jgi:hypothetical protein